MSGDRSKTSTSWTQPSGRRWIDREIAQVVARQRTMVSLGQLRGIGLSASAVRSRVGSGRLHRVHRGVFSVVPGPWPYAARCAAGALAYGGAWASDRSAADVLDLVKATSPIIEVTVVGGHGYSRPGLRAHRAAALHADDRCDVDGVPCTSVARTLLDLAARSPQRLVERAVEQSEKLGLFDLQALDGARARAPGHHGHAVLNAVLADYVETGTRLELERRFLELVTKAGLLVPERNVWVPELAQEVDCLWRDARVIVELDSRAHHLTTLALQRDRERVDAACCTTSSRCATRGAISRAHPGAPWTNCAR